MNRAVLIATCFMVAAAATGGVARADDSLVKLERTAPPAGHVYFYVAGRHHSRLAFDYDDDPRGLSEDWNVDIRFKGCPVTPRGSVRLTVYEFDGEAGPNNGSFDDSLSSMPRGAKQYSQTAVFHVSHAYVWFTFPSNGKHTNIYEVIVPARHGCKSWSLGFTTN